MSKLGWLVTTALAVMVAAPAHADYVEATYSGSVAEVGAAAPTGLDVGTSINFDVVFDTSKLVDYTAAVNAATGSNFASVEVASLSDDPNASLSITAGPISFTKYDGLQYGTPQSDCTERFCGPAGLSIGNLPAVLYIDGQFAGLSNIFVNGSHESLDADPIADYLAGGFGLDGPGEGSYDFYLGHSSLDPVSNPFQTGYAVGDIDLDTLLVTPLDSPVPEPATWALMIGGFGLIGAAARNRQPIAKPANILSS